MPVLVHDRRVLRESTVINEYLDDILPIPAAAVRSLGTGRDARSTKYVDEYFCPALTVWVRTGLQHFLEDRQAVMAHRLADMPNEEVRRKWATISDAGFSMPSWPMPGAGSAIVSTDWKPSSATGAPG